MHWLLCMIREYVRLRAICIAFVFDKMKRGKKKQRRKRNRGHHGFAFIVRKITCAQHLFLFQSSAAAIKPTIGYLVEQGIILESNIEKKMNKNTHPHIINNMK